MKIVVSELPLVLQVIIAVAVVAGLFGGFLSAFVGTGLVLFRGRLVFTPEEDWKLDMADRMSRRGERASLILSSPKFRLERRMIGFGLASFLASFVLIITVGLLFGQQA